MNVPQNSQPMSSFLEHIGFFKTLDTDLDGVVTFDLFKVGTSLGFVGEGTRVVEYSYLPGAGACGLRASPKEWAT